MSGDKQGSRSGQWEMERASITSLSCSSIDWWQCSEARHTSKRGGDHPRGTLITGVNSTGMLLAPTIHWHRPKGRREEGTAEQAVSRKPVSKKKKTSKRRQWANSLVRMYYKCRNHDEPERVFWVVLFLHWAQHEMNERKQDREKYGKGPEAELTLLATRNCRMTTDIMLMFYRVQTPLPRRQEYTRYEHVKIACKKRK